MTHILYSLIKQPLHIIWHQNERVYFSLKKQRDLLILRLHTLFYDAPLPLLDAIAEYVMYKDPKARLLLKKGFYDHVKEKSLEPKPLSPFGKVYNLEELLGGLQKSMKIAGLCIGWGKDVKKSRSRCITFGSFDPLRKQIRIHPLLDDPRVPLYFLEYVVYHEMLHALYPSEMGISGRVIIHGKAFREKEKEFAYFKQAKQWEKENFKLFQKTSFETRFA